MGTPSDSTTHPKTSTSSDETHAALATVDGVNIEENATQTISATMRTDTQLRTGDDPNPWEVAWFLWNYTDDQHFYAVVLKPNGWEISKEDPAYPGAQRFLASGDSPTFPVGSAFDITVTITTAEDAVTMTVSVGGAELATVTDRRPGPLRPTQRMPPSPLARSPWSPGPCPTESNNRLQEEMIP